MLAKLLESGPELDPAVRQQLRATINALFRMAGFKDIEGFSNFLAELYSHFYDDVIEKHEILRSFVISIMKKLGIKNLNDPKFTEFLKQSLKAEQN